MTVTEWIRENYAEYGKDFVVNGIDKCRAVTNHNSSGSTWDRQVRRVIRDMEGSGPEPESAHLVKTVDDAMAYHDIPEHLYDVSKIRVNTWGSETNSNQQVRVELKPKEFTLDPEVWAQIFREASANVPAHSNKPHSNTRKDTMHLMSIPDVHFGKSVVAKTIGGEKAIDYDPNIAANLLMESVKSLSASVERKKTTSIIFPQGEDTFNVDNLSSTTTAGTPQNNSDIYEMIRIGVNAVFQAIDYLAEITNVSVPIVSGNHDRLLSHMMGIIIEERYRKDKRVSVETSPVREKIISFGDSGIFLIHGDKMKSKDVAWRFATKYPSLWGKVKHRYAFSGHYHQTYFTDEHGVLVSFLPSLVPTGSWEDAMNYFSTRQAQLHTFDSQRGRIMTAYYTPE